MILPATEEVSLRSELLDAWDVSTILTHTLGGTDGSGCRAWARPPGAGARDRGGGHAIGRRRPAWRMPALERRGRIAVQDAVELVPTFDWPEDRLILMMAGGEAALLRSVENAEDRVDLAAAIVEQHAIGAERCAGGSRRQRHHTNFTVAAVATAREHGALTIAIANSAGTPLLSEAECPF